jgi:hypothetical protein
MPASAWPGTVHLADRRVDDGHDRIASGHQLSGAGDRHFRVRRTDVAIRAIMLALLARREPDKEQPSTGQAVGTLVQHSSWESRS